MGSLRVYRGFDPRIFERQGVIIFVLGSSSQTPLQPFVLLKFYLDDLNANLVVCDLFPSSFAIKGAEPTLDLLANDRIVELGLEMAFEQRDLMVWNGMIYVTIMNAIGKHNDFEGSVHKPKEHDTYVSAGYVHKDLNFIKEVEICEKEKAMRWHEPLNLQLMYFDKMISLLERNYREFIFVHMPIAHFPCYSNNDILDKRLSESVPYIDFNQLLDFQDSIDFFDEYHLNEKGIKKLGSFLSNDKSFFSSLNGDK